MNGYLMTLNRKHALSAILLFASLTSSAQTPSATDQAHIRDYIRNGWDTLSRSMSECKSVVDIKVNATPVLYLPADLPTPPAVDAMRKSCAVDVRHLPRVIHHIDEVPPSALPVQGLLYLPNRYVVPGGRFNEMYGWDSYFILLGLEHDGRRALAQGMVENFFFEIQHYGAILNANRTYYFTRSQPPFLSSMIREVYEHPAPGAPPDKQWLARAYTYAQRDYALWISPEHRAGNTGLAHYHDLGEGPVPEESDDSSYYPDVIRWLLAHPGDHPEYLVKGSAHPTPCRSENPRSHQLRRNGFPRLRAGRRGRSSALRCVLPGRPCHARIRLRPQLPLRPLLRFHRPIRSHRPQ